MRLGTVLGVTCAGIGALVLSPFVGPSPPPLTVTQGLVLGATLLVIGGGLLLRSVTQAWRWAR
jgi:hypothetical protein